MRRHDGFGEGIDRVRVGDVEAVTGPVAALTERTGRLDSGGLVEVGDHDSRPDLGQGTGDLETDATRPAGDDGNTVG